MFKDCRGLPLTTASEQAAAAFDHAIDGYLGYRADMPDRMEALLAADPDFGLAHCLKGYLFLMGFRADLLGAARALWRRHGVVPERRGRQPMPRRWPAGSMVTRKRAVAVWDQILQDHPHDILAFRLAHFLNFWSGRPDAMLASVLSVERHWSRGAAGIRLGAGLPLLRASRRPDTTWKPKLPAGKRSASTAPTCGRHTALPMCWK